MTLHLCHSFSSCGVNVSSWYLVKIEPEIHGQCGENCPKCKWCLFSADVTFPQYKYKHTRTLFQALWVQIVLLIYKSRILIIPLSRVIGINRNMAQCNLTYMFPFSFNCLFMEISISNKLVLSGISREYFAIINLCDAYLGGATHIINQIIQIIRAQLSLYSIECSIEYIQFNFLKKISK